MKMKKGLLTALEILAGTLIILGIWLGSAHLSYQNNRLAAPDAAKEYDIFYGISRAIDRELETDVHSQEQFTILYHWTVTGIGLLQNMMSDVQQYAFALERYHLGWIDPSAGKIIRSENIEKLMTWMERLAAFCLASERMENSERTISDEMLKQAQECIRELEGSLNDVCQGKFDGSVRWKIRALKTLEEQGGWIEQLDELVINNET